MYLKSPQVGIYFFVNSVKIQSPRFRVKSKNQQQNLSLSCHPNGSVSPRDPTLSFRREGPREDGFSQGRVMQAGPPVSAREQSALSPH